MSLNVNVLQFLDMTSYDLVCVCFGIHQEELASNCISSAVIGVLRYASGRATCGSVRRPFVNIGTFPKSRMTSNMVHTHLSSNPRDFFYLGHCDLLSDLWAKVHLFIITLWKWLYLISYLTYRYMVSTIEVVHLGTLLQWLCQQWPIFEDLSHIDKYLK